MRYAIVVIAAAGCFGQGQDPAFDVFSVKPGGPVTVVGGPGRKTVSTARPFRYTGGSMTARETLKGMIQEAYSLEDWAVEGPSWFNEDVYDLQAVMPAGTSRETGRRILRTALAERFGLKFHTVKREISVYALVAVSKAIKLQPAGEKSTGYAEMTEEKFTATGSLDAIATYSRRFAERPVINMTGVEGIYHLELHWTPDPDDRFAPGFWRALEKEAGLRREARKIPRDVIVVDHAERTPTAN